MFKTMLSRLKNLLNKMRESLLFVPAMVCALYLLVLAAIMGLERTLLADIEIWEIFFQGNLDEAKAVIVTLLSAMITMTTLAVSITIVVLSLAASQLGPRLIKSFISDRLTQIYIGIFFGTVTVCFVLTGILHDPFLAEPTPGITISAVFAACFIDLFVLLAFINHVARASIADSVIDRVSKNLLEAIAHQSQRNEENFKPEKEFPSDFTTYSRTLFFQQHGYVQNIDYEYLLKLAEKNDLFIKITFKAGHYLLPGENGVYVYPERQVTPELENEILEAFIIGKKRTSTQDVRYSMRHLIEIAIRALSPSINDSFTAIAVIDHLAAAMAYLFQKHLPLYHFTDDGGQLRIMGFSNSESELISYAFSLIRHSGQNKPAVLKHLMLKLAVLINLANTDEQKECLYKELALVQEAITRNLSGSEDGRELEALYSKLTAKPAA